MKPGIYYDLDDHAYRKIRAINKSGLDKFDQSPAHYYAEYLAQIKPVQKSTPAKRFGVLAHARLLEPERFETKFCIEPENAPKRPTEKQRSAKKVSSKTLEAIAFWDGFDDFRGERESVSWAELQKLDEMAESSKKNIARTELITRHGHAEVTLVWEDPEFKVLCKARVDWLEGVMLDLKTTINASPEAFGRQAANLHYYRQAAWYRDGYKVLTSREIGFVFWAVEKEEPFASKFYWVKDDALALGRDETRAHLKTYAECLEKNIWPSYSDEVADLELPQYAFKKSQRAPEPATLEEY